jgi:hypothetical protein
LKRLAQAPVVYEMPGTTRGEWDRFSVRNLGFAVARRTAERFGGDPNRMRDAAVKRISNVLGVATSDFGRNQLRAFGDLAAVLTLADDLKRWTPDELNQVVRILRAKTRHDEADYLRMMQKHARMRKVLIDLGSNAAPEA